MSVLLHNYLVIGAILFGLGAIGFLTRRNLIVMFLCVEMMLSGVALNMVGFGNLHRNMQGQSFVIFMLAVAACEAAMALAVFLILYRSRRTLDISVWQELRDPGLEPVVDTKPLPEDPSGKPVEYPKLTPAGLRPDESDSSEPRTGLTEEVTRA